MDEFDRKHLFLVKEVYCELENLNTGFDSPFIYYFNESDFEIVLNRVEKLNISIGGIEPWFSNKYYDVKTVEDYNTQNLDKQWYRIAFDEFKAEKKELQYGASYFVPKDLLTKGAL